MEKITKKKKAKKGLKKRIGLIAIGGLSLVLTVCLSVGATLAWFAGSTWSSKQLYMGGPVYVEMAGDGTSVGEGGAAGTAKWKGGSGNLQMEASTRNRGTVLPAEADEKLAVQQGVLLPGQKFQVYSQARVYSTSYTNTVKDGDNRTPSQSSGANTKNTNSGDGTAHVTNNGRITTTTTSVLRARFSIKVEFDPSMGFNDFTQEDYRLNYPLQSQAFKGANNLGDEGAAAASLTWESALGNGSTGVSATVNEYKPALNAAGDAYEYPAKARRDAVVNATAAGYVPFTNADRGADMEAIKAGTKRSIYKWKFVSKSVYYGSQTAQTESVKKAGGAGYEAPTTPGVPADGLSEKYTYAQMPAPFDGSDTTTSGKNGYYGVWVLEETGADAAKKYVKSESDSFYKERCNAYIDSYCEEYLTEYDSIQTRTIGSSIDALESALNKAFKDLVDDSSDAIQAGYLNGRTEKDEDGNIDYDKSGVTAVDLEDRKGSWLYIDPTIGNDTNTNELATGMGGWWYLVKSDGSVKNKENKINAITDSVTSTTTTEDGKQVTTWNGKSNKTVAYENAGGGITTTGTTDADKVSTFTRQSVTATNTDRLYAELYEINPLNALDAIQSSVSNPDMKKIVSYSFPFVNGTAALPGDEITNIFANAKITIQISFQALQAFLPFSSSIDGMDYKNPLLGTAKALNIKNAIPIFNEAFDYQESFSVDLIDNL